MQALPPGLDRLWAPEPGKPRRGGLTAGKVVAAAIELADAEGLDAVSMARVANALGFTTMSLYRHVRSKDELLVLMMDRVMALPPAEPYDGWRAGLEGWAWDILRLVRAHPWVLYVRISPPPATPASVTLMERGLAPLAGTPLAEDEKAQLILTINGYVFWQARLEAELAPGSGDPATDPLAAYVTVMHTLVDDRWPAVKRVVDAGVFDDAEDTRDADFAFGLERILDGVEAMLRR
nr:TetR/AcrR family transcriptional regulator [Candidatus Solirubrobacter pratensis]